MVLFHRINNIWIEVETFQLFNKQLGPLSTPPGPLLTSLLSPLTNDWQPRNERCDSLFLCFLRLFFLFSSQKEEKLGKGQWEGATVLSTTNLRKKAFPAGSGGLKCQSGTLRRLSLGLCGVKGGFQHLIPLACLGRASRPCRALFCCLARLSDPFQTSPQQEKREAGLGRKGQERSDMAPSARQGWACSRVPQGFHREPRTVRGAGPPPLLEEAWILLLPVIQIQAWNKKNFSFKGLIEMLFKDPYTWMNSS